MKQCPACRTTYTDATLVYCLADGAPLESLAGEQETVVRPAGQPMRVDVSHEAQRPGAPPPNTVNTAPAGSSNVVLKVLLGLLALGFLVAAAIAIGALVYFNMQGRAEVAQNTNQATPKPTATPAANETDELRDQIANLERLINEQKKNNQPVNVPLTLPKQMTTTTTAPVDSPGDGFLALRSLPNSQVGARILKIPHGATVSIGACGPVVRPVNRAGRWCQASYGGYTGWVFDAFLVY